MANPNGSLQFNDIGRILNTVRARPRILPSTQYDLFGYGSDEINLDQPYAPGYHTHYQDLPDARFSQPPTAPIQSNSAIPRSAGFYAPMYIDSDQSTQRAGRQGHYSVRSASSYQRSRGSNLSEGHETYSMTSYSSAPSGNGPPPAHMQQHLPLPDPGFGPRIIPCELEPVTGCPERFHLNNIDGWTRHIVEGHMDGMYPENSMCWFCNIEFPARTLDFEDRRTAFLERMRHIHGDLVRSGTSSGRRADFVLMRFFHEIGAISHEQHEDAKNRLAEVRAPREFRPQRPRARTPVTIIVENPNGRQIRSQR